MSVSTENLVHRLGTERFIAADPSQITLKTRQTTMVAGTKTVVNGPDRPEQTFKIIWNYDNGVARFIQGDRGGVRRFDFILVGTYDAIVAIGDYWTVGNQRFEIEYLFPGNDYEVKAGGISHGASPT